MPTIYTEIEINAPRDQVWMALIRKENWRQWNSFLFDRDPQQRFQTGRSLLLSLKRVPREKETEFKASVVTVQPNRCLQWVSDAPGYRSEHRFELQDSGLRRTQYRHHERISGLLSPLFLPFIRQDEHNGMRRMASDLKHYAEWLSRQS
ncbi:MAG: SRPBCC domain-containing protein [Leptolyngbyaceae bacterium]|nr:SRPBCC domain-containing protein [Leptolyngbyaceae bacterium]